MKEQHHNYLHDEVQALRVLCDEQQRQIADLKKLVRWQAKKLQEEK